MPKCVTPTVEQAFVTAQATIQLWHTAQHALNFLRNQLFSEVRNQRDQQLAEALSVLHSAVYREELDAWRHAMMFGLLSKPADRTALIKEMVPRFLGPRFAVMEHLLGSSPGSWLSSDEEDFRKAIQEAFEASIQEGA